MFHSCEEDSSSQCMVLLMFTYIFAGICMAVVGPHAIRSVAALASAGKFTEARASAHSSAGLMVRTRYGLHYVLTYNNSMFHIAVFLWPNFNIFVLFAHMYM